MLQNRQICDWYPSSSSVPIPKTAISQFPRNFLAISAIFRTFSRKPRVSIPPLLLFFLLIFNAFSTPPFSFVHEEWGQPTIPVGGSSPFLYPPGPRGNPHGPVGGLCPADPDPDARGGRALWRAAGALPGGRLRPSPTSPPLQCPTAHPGETGNRG